MEWTTSPSLHTLPSRVRLLVLVAPVKPEFAPGAGAVQSDEVMPLFRAALGAIGRLAERHPEARIIMAHIGGTWAFREGIAVARAHDNVWADTSGWPLVAGGIMEVALRELGASKFVFGTDYPLCDIDTWVSRLERLPVSDAQRERIAWRNAAELMGMAS